MCWGCIYKAQNIVQVQQNFVSVLRVPVADLRIITEPRVSSIQATCPFVSETQKEAVTVLPQEDVWVHRSVAVLRRACRGLLKVPWEYDPDIKFRFFPYSMRLLLLGKINFWGFFLKRDNFSQLWHWVLLCQILIWKVKLLLFTLSSLPHTSANQCPSMVATYEDLSLWIIQISIQNYVRVQRILKKLGVACGV